MVSEIQICQISYYCKWDKYKIGIKAFGEIAVTFNSRIIRIDKERAFFYTIHKRLQSSEVKVRIVPRDKRKIEIYHSQ